MGKELKFWQNNQGDCFFWFLPFFRNEEIVVHANGQIYTFMHFLNQFLDFTETLYIWALLKGNGSEHIRFYTKYIASKIIQIFQRINYLFSPFDKIIKEIAFFDFYRIFEIQCQKPLLLPFKTDFRSKICYKMIKLGTLISKGFERIVVKLFLNLQSFLQPAIFQWLELRMRVV